MKDRSATFRQVFSIFIVLIVLMAGFTFAAYPNFLTKENLFSITLQTATIAIIALGQTLVLVTGGIDLSIGSNIALSGVVTAICLKSGMPDLLSAFMGISATGLVGIFNGLFVAYGKLSPFVVTLGSMSIVRGLTLLITEGRPIAGLPTSFRFYGNGNIFEVPVPVIIVIIATCLLHIILKYTRMGLHIYAIGSNKEAVKLSGINSEKVYMQVYVFSGLLSGLAGVIFASRLITGQPSAGGGYELLSIASAVIGGTSLSGGEGSVWGTIIGALIIGVLGNGLNLIGVSSFVQQVLVGFIIIFAISVERFKEMFDEYSKKQKNK